ncbi:hypothetical protein ABK046_52720, partial [Streptomyces caeruleatus]
VYIDNLPPVDPPPDPDPGDPVTPPPANTDPITTTGVTSLTRNGVTWTFSGTVQHGRYADGTDFVVGPVTITAITPAY